MHNSVKNKKGFTLVELLVVMAIIAILIGLAIAGLNIARRNSRDTTRKSDLQGIELMLEEYYGNHGEYPSALDFKVNGEVTLTEGSESVTLDFDFNGTSSGSSNGASCTVPATPKSDVMVICYKPTSGRQGYVLEVGLEGTSDFVLDHTTP